MAIHLPASVVRAGFADLINRVAYGGERIMITRREKAIAALVPVADVELLDRLAGLMPLDQIESALAGATAAPRPVPVAPDQIEDIRREVYEQARREVYEQVRQEAQKRLEALISGRRPSDKAE